MNKDINTAWDKFFSIILILFMALSLVGFIDSAYLTIEHYKSDPIVCLIIEGCDLVLNSQYSTVFGIPISLLGTLYYFLIFCFSVFSFRKRKETVFKYLSFFTIVGLIVSLWFVYLQFFIIKAICTYCIISTFNNF